LNVIKFLLAVLCIIHGSVWKSFVLLKPNGLIISLNDPAITPPDKLVTDILIPLAPDK